MTKPLLQLIFACGLLTAIFPRVLVAGSCALNGGDPISAKSIVFTSKSGMAMQMGHIEYADPSTPPRFYRTETISGQHHSSVVYPEGTATMTMVLSGSMTWDRITGVLTNTELEEWYSSSIGFLWSFDGMVSLGVWGDVVRTQTKITSVYDYDSSDPFGRPAHLSADLAAELSDEDTLEDAFARARANPILGASSTAFRSPTNFCDVHFVAAFDVECAGEYDVYLHYSSSPLIAGQPVTNKTVITRRRLHTGSQTVEGDIQVEADNTAYTLQGVDLRSPCSDQPPSHSEITLGSVKVGLNLGRGIADVTSGEIRLDAETISAATYTPSALIAAVSQGVEVARDATGALRQLKAPQTLADIITINSSSYEVRFYGPSDVGAQDEVTKLYTLTGAPYAAFQFENPDAPQSVANRLRITETRGGIVRVSEYSYDSSAKTWTLDTGNSLRRESVNEVVSGLDTTKICTVRDESNAIISSTSKTYHVYPWGRELVKEVLDASGIALTTTTDFYSDLGADGGAYSHIKQRVNADNSWTRYTYDNSGRSLKTVRPYLNASVTAEDNLCRVTENSYTALSDADGDGNNEQLTATSEKIHGQEIARSYRIDWSRAVTIGGDVCSHRSDIRCVAAGAAWNDSANLTTETLTYTNDPFVGRTRWVLNPDGTAVWNSYAIDTGGQTVTTTRSGAANATFNDIALGTTIVTTTSALGQVTSEATTDIASGLTLSYWMVTTFDALGRPTRIDYENGTFELRSYSCCGLGTVTDRAGSVTSNTYDAFGRVNNTTRGGITTHTDYDAEGRVLKVTRIGSDNTGIVQQTNVYDLVGRLFTSKDALGRTTAYSKTSDTSGHNVKTTTGPTSALVETYAKDGSRVSVSGSAAVQQLVYEYGIDADGVFTKEIRVGSSGETTEWTKTYADFAGRPYKTVYADGSAQQNIYNTSGQLAKTIDPDGVTTLYAYNSRGERNAVALDLDRNGTIDYSGTDRIATYTTLVTTAHGMTVRQATSAVTAIDGDATLQTVLLSESSADDLHTWQTVDGLTTTVDVVYHGGGIREEIVTTPDQLQSIRQYENGRLTTDTTLHATLGTLGSVTYGYDAAGRVQTMSDVRTGTTTYSYHDDDQVHTVTTPDPDTSKSGEGYDRQTTSYSYDASGRLQTTTLPDATTVTQEYYPTGQLKRTYGSRIYPRAFTYDRQGRVKTVTTWQDYAGQTGAATTKWNYDAARGWLISKQYNDTSGPSYSHWPSGRLHTRTRARTVNDAALVTTYTYNNAGDLSCTTYSDVTPAVLLAYDRRGRVFSATDAAGTLTRNYHTSGQLESENYGTGGLLWNFGVNRSFDSLNRFQTVSAVSGSATLSASAYGYDEASRLKMVSNGTNMATYGYLPKSNLVQTLAFTNGSIARLTTTETWDSLNRLKDVASITSASSVVQSSYVYSNINQRMRLTREDNTYWKFAYDSLGQVASGRKYLADDAGWAGYDYAYNYDDIGNRKVATVNGQASTYTPTLLNQYSQRVIPGAIDVIGAAASDATVTVTFPSTDGTIYPTTRQGEDFYQQLRVTNDSTSHNYSLTVTGVKNNVGNGNDDVTSFAKTAFIAKTPESFTYDADGNLTRDSKWNYSWDAENRLISMETTAAAVTAGVPKQKLEFAYDYQGRRIAKKAYSWNAAPGSWLLQSSLLFLYDGWNLLAEVDGLSVNAVVRNYVWGLDLSGSMQGAGGVGGLLMVNSGSATYITTYDGNGNLLGLVNAANGALAADYEYDPFGNVIKATGVAATAQPFGFSTKYADSETGLNYYGLRYYNPSTGRWLSRDPIEEQGGANLYAMVGNSPVDRVDPLGLEILVYQISETSRHYATSTQFTLNVMTGFRQVIGDAGVIGVERINDENGDPLAWKIVVRSENPESKCSKCWQQLKAAIEADFEIRIRYNPYADSDQSGHPFGPVRDVYVNPNGNVFLPEVQPGYVYSRERQLDYTYRRAPFPIVLWHEAIGHSSAGLEHPLDAWNQQGAKTTEVDPVLEIENIARECLRQNGFEIGNRYPKYYRVREP